MTEEAVQGESPGEWLLEAWKVTRNGAKRDRGGFSGGKPSRAAAVRGCLASDGCRWACGCCVARAEPCSRGREMHRLWQL